MRKRHRRGALFHARVSREKSAGGDAEAGTRLSPEDALAYSYTHVSDLRRSCSTRDGSGLHVRLRVYKSESGAARRFVARSDTVGYSRVPRPSNRLRSSPFEVVVRVMYPTGWDLRCVILLWGGFCSQSHLGEYGLSLLNRSHPAVDGRQQKIIQCIISRFRNPIDGPKQVTTTSSQIILR